MVVRRRFTDSGPETMFSMLKGNPKEVPEAIEIEPKWKPKQAKEPSKTPLRDRVEKVSKKVARRRKPGGLFGEQSLSNKNITKTSSKTFKVSDGKTLIIVSEDCQQNAKRSQQSSIVQLV